MRAVFKKDGVTTSQEIIFGETNGIDFEFSKKELNQDNVQDLLQDLSFLAAIPFIRYCQNTAFDLQQAKMMKDYFLSELGELLDSALADDAPIGEAIRRKNENELYGFMEELYNDWINKVPYEEEAFLKEFKEYTFLQLQPFIGNWFTIEMVFDNNKGHQVIQPLVWLYNLENATDEKIRQNISRNFLIAIVILDRLGKENPLREENMPAFENEIFEIVKEALQDK